MNDTRHNNGGPKPWYGPAGRVPIPCDQIQEILFDYMARELGESRSALVYEHVRKCSDCKRVAADMQATLEMLKAGDPADEVILELSARHRRRLRRAARHPILDWMMTHHWVVSGITAILVVLLALVVLARLRQLQEALPEGVSVNLRPPAVQETPDAMERPSGESEE